jgi:hypothetical protein
LGGEIIRGTPFEARLDGVTSQVFLTSWVGVESFFISLVDPPGVVARLVLLPNIHEVVSDQEEAGKEREEYEEHVAGAGHSVAARHSLLADGHRS